MIIYPISGFQFVQQIFTFLTDQVYCLDKG